MLDKELKTMASKEEEEQSAALKNHSAEEESRPEAEQHTMSRETRMVKLGKVFRRRGESILLVGVHLSHYLSDYQFIGLISTLTSDWKLSLFAAVIITNVHKGATPLLAIFVAWFADTYLGDCLTLMISTMIYIIGMVMWYCAQWHFRNKNPMYYFWGFLCVALLLIMVGQCGYINYTKEKNAAVQKIELETTNNEEEKGVVEQGAGNNNQDRLSETQQSISQFDGMDQLVSFCTRTKNALKKIVRLCIKKWIHISGFFIAVFVITPMVFLIIMMLVSLLLFAIGKLFIYPLKKPTGSPLSVLFNVIQVAFKRRRDDCLTEIYNGDSHGNCVDAPENCAKHHGGYSQNSVKIFRCLNRAALYNPSSIENPNVEFEKGRLCSVQQVEDTKVFIGCICLSLLFLTYGLMTAVADTFFIEQAAKMNTKIGIFDVPVQIFVLGLEATRRLVSCICQWVLAKRLEAPQRRFRGALRVGFGMLLSFPCFVIAAIIDDKKTSVLWLTPQLILVAIMDGLVVDGINCFFQQEMPVSVGKSYSRLLAEGIVGLGKLLSIGWFCLCYFATKIDGKRGWFGNGIKESRLHRYYTIMAAFALLSFILYVLVATVHFLTQSQLPEESLSSDGQLIIRLPSQKHKKLLASESMRHRTSAKLSYGTD